ncbi:MAG: pyruvate formate lyase activating enzyme [Clostridia bacterium]|nr:pyruvate formate lyase activating enzyme [Clostridia bacterium]
MTEAKYYVKLEDGKVKCSLCPHNCIIGPGNRGVCRVRENREGDLITLNFGRCSSLALDPIEKKPLYHFYPGSNVLSTGTYGCNFSCQFCQNWQIAQTEPQTVTITPEDLVNKAKELNSLGIAYTYSEPLVWFEFVLATAKLAREAGLKNIMVTNGFIEPEPLAELLQLIDAWNVDIKGFNQDFYRKVVRGDYQPVLRTSAAVAKSGGHIEITTLIVPELNDNIDELTTLVRWVRDNLGIDTPIHFSRYFPRYRLKLSPTPLTTMERVWEKARQYLHYVYLGNVPGIEANNTYCPFCDNLVIRRMSYNIVIEGLIGRKCSNCGEELAIVTKE